MQQDVNSSAAGRSFGHPRRESEVISLRLLQRLRITPDRAKRYVELARRNGTTIQVEALADPSTNANAYFAAMAELLGLPFIANVEASQILAYDRPLEDLLSDADGATAVYFRRSGGRLLLLVSPTEQQAYELDSFLTRYPHLRDELVMTPRAVLRRAIIAKTSGAMLNRSASRLFVQRPDLSARLVTNTWQSALLGSGAVLIPVLWWAFPQVASLALYGLASLFFLACVLLRTLALSSKRFCYNPLASIESIDRLPVYTVLVALYREDNIVGDLLVALSSLRWPRSKLDIKLVCEQHDRKTIQAIKAHALSSMVEVIEVPEGGPRTKPNALTYALQVCRGEFVVLYDAEDRPHPDQLQEAWQVFSREDERLACLQAPLVITNGHINRLTGMFAHEYAGLFRGLLPWLARRGLVLPLGGTSNHFRRRALENAMAWDPYNVTEDADLGLRLVRLGYRCSTITRPTLEEAPDTLAVWLGQRTRWMKGWMQCWLVHNRNPATLLNDLKIKSFIVSQILLVGIISSMLIHPITYIIITFDIIYLFNQGAPGAYHFIFPALGLASTLVAYVTFYLLGRAASTPLERRRNRVGLFFIPVYWLLLSVAGWRAAWELFRRPHYWEKTPHKRLVSAPPASPPDRK
ncbi:MAG: glycosyltransferase [Notoacmeibacter sp.]|nr:glycosyltransferase [Notoacmeibacter sp.]